MTKLFHSLENIILESNRIINNLQKILSKNNKSIDRKKICFHKLAEVSLKVRNQIDDFIDQLCEYDRDFKKCPFFHDLIAGDCFDVKGKNAIFLLEKKLKSDRLKYTPIYVDSVC